MDILRRSAEDYARRHDLHPLDALELQVARPLRRHLIPHLPEDRLHWWPTPEPLWEDGMSKDTRLFCKLRYPPNAFPVGPEHPNEFYTSRVPKFHLRPKRVFPFVWWESIKPWRVYYFNPNITSHAYDERGDRNEVRTRLRAWALSEFGERAVPKDVLSHRRPSLLLAPHYRP